MFIQSLTKLPKDYPDKKSLPHVQVALRMISRNEHVQSGDVIPYIVCEVHVCENVYTCTHTGTVYNTCTVPFIRKNGLHLDKALFIVFLG